jgi:non-ribosomal peptide synthetase component E (peptide arylation enzyme)
VSWGPFPTVRGVRNQAGAWDHAGVSRNPILSDGSTATEKLTEYSPGQSFAYEVTASRTLCFAGSYTVYLIAEVEMADEPAWGIRRGEKGASML